MWRSAPRNPGSRRHREAFRSLQCRPLDDALQKADIVDIYDQATRQLCQILSVEYSTLENAVCLLRCYVTLRIAQGESSFDWDAFVADVFGVHGDEHAIRNGVRHLQDLRKMLGVL